MPWWENPILKTNQHNLLLISCGCPFQFVRVRWNLHCSVGLKIGGTNDDGSVFDDQLQTYHSCPKRSLSPQQKTAHEAKRKVIGWVHPPKTKKAGIWTSSNYVNRAFKYYGFHLTLSRQLTLQAEVPFFFNGKYIFPTKQPQIQWLLQELRWIRGPWKANFFSHHLPFLFFWSTKQKFAVEEKSATEKSTCRGCSLCAVAVTLYGIHVSKLANETFSCERAMEWAECLNLTSSIWKRKRVPERSFSPVSF